MELRQKLTLNKPLSHETLIKINLDKTQKDQQAIEKDTQKRIIEEKKQKYKRIKNALDWLCQRYPECFNHQDPKPLKLRIEIDVLREYESLADQEETPSRKSLRDAIKYYAHNIKYFKAHLNQTQRINLQGDEMADDPVTSEHKAYAQKMIDVFEAKKTKSKTRTKSESQFKAAKSKANDSSLQLPSQPQLQSQLQSEDSQFITQELTPTQTLTPALIKSTESHLELQELELQDSGALNLD